MTGYMTKLVFFFLHFVRVSKSPFFFLVRYATRLRRSLGRCATSCIEARLRSLLRTYERLTCRKSCMLFTDTKSGPMKKRTSTPIYTTCTSPIMHLLCPPKFSVSTILNFPWDGCNIQEKWKTTWKVMQNFFVLGGGGQIRCIMGDVQGESSYLDRTSLVNKGFIFIGKLSWFWFTTVCLAVI